MRTSMHRVARLLGAAGAVALIGAAAVSSPAGADRGGNPPGNNGTIKVDGVEFDAHPNNEPHVGCTFQIDFYGYEAEAPVVMVFSAQPPTGKAVLLTVNGVLDDDDASGGGSEEGYDGGFTIDLSEALEAYEPQPQQGFHVRLEITAPDGQKHKVFWVSGCGNEPPTSPTSTPTSPTSTPTSPTSTPTSPTSTPTSPTSTPTSGAVVTPTSAAVLPTEITREPTTAAPASVTTAPTQVAGRQLPRTGGLQPMLLLAGSLLVLQGLVLEVAARKAERR
jgi:hypothetical protein